LKLHIGQYEELSADFLPKIDKFIKPKEERLRKSQIKKMSSQLILVTLEETLSKLYLNLEEQKQSAQSTLSQPSFHLRNRSKSNKKSARSTSKPGSNNGMSSHTTNNVLYN
jgi:hypothetical protein